MTEPGPSSNLAVPPVSRQATIPRIIHVCWFGGTTPNRKTSRCLASIHALRHRAYDIRVWDETTYDLGISARLAAARDRGQWSLVSNYVRLDVLSRYGGIYLDADVEVIKPFDDLLDAAFFIGFIWDCTLGTAVIGSVPGQRIVADILAAYEADPATFISPNNNTFTDYFLASCPGFRLDGTAQRVGDIVFLDKYAFEHPSLTRRGNYTVHHFAQSWVGNSRAKTGIKRIVIWWLSLWLYRKYVCWRSLRISPYYAEYRRQRRRAVGRRAMPAAQARRSGLRGEP